MASPSSEPDVVSIGPDFQVLELLGQGGMAAVYRARQLSLDRVVAVKVIDCRRVIRSAAQRFSREARLASRLQHPNIVSTFGHGTTSGGSMWISMELLEGRTLASVLQHEGALSAYRAMHIARQILSGLAAAHEAGILHRDLKPSNVFLSRPAGYREDFAKLLDFGLALSWMNPEPITAVDHVVGTVGYMSPEQSAGHDVDVRSDLYSVGVLLHEMLFGRPPVGAASEPPRPSAPAGLPPMPPALIALIDRLVSFRPDERPASVHQVLEMLDRVDEAPASATAGPTEAYRASKPRPATTERRWLPLAGAVLGLGWLVQLGLTVLPIGRPATRGVGPTPTPLAAEVDSPPAAPAPASRATPPSGLVVEPPEATPPKKRDGPTVGAASRSVEPKEATRGPRDGAMVGTARAVEPSAATGPRRGPTVRAASRAPPPARGRRRTKPSSRCPRGWTIESTPTRALVEANGRPAGRTPWRSEESASRPQAIRISAAGFRAKTLSLSAASPCRVHVRLEVRDPTAPAGSGRP